MGKDEGGKKRRKRSRDSRNEVKGLKEEKDDDEANSKNHRKTRKKDGNEDDRITGAFIKEVVDDGEGSGSAGGELSQSPGAVVSIFSDSRDLASVNGRKWRRKEETRETMQPGLHEVDCGKGNVNFELETSTRSQTMEDTSTIQTPEVVSTPRLSSNERRRKRKEKKREKRHQLVQAPEVKKEEEEGDGDLPTTDVGNTERGASVGKARRGEGVATSEGIEYRSNEAFPPSVSLDGARNCHLGSEIPSIEEAMTSSGSHPRRSPLAVDDETLLEDMLAAEVADAGDSQTHEDTSEFQEFQDIQEDQEMTGGIKQERDDGEEHSQNDFLLGPRNRHLIKRAAKNSGEYKARCVDVPALHDWLFNAAHDEGELSPEQREAWVHEMPPGWQDFYYFWRQRQVDLALPYPTLLPAEEALPWGSWPIRLRLHDDGMRFYCRRAPKYVGDESNLHDESLRTPLPRCQGQELRPTVKRFLPLGTQGEWVPAEAPPTTSEEEASVGADTGRHAGTAAGGPCSGGKESKGALGGTAKLGAAEGGGHRWLVAEPVKDTVRRVWARHRRRQRDTEEFSAGIRTDPLSSKGVGHDHCARVPPDPSLGLSGARRQWGGRVSIGGGGGVVSPRDMDRNAATASGGEAEALNGGAVTDQSWGNYAQVISRHVSPGGVTTEGGMTPGLEEHLGRRCEGMIDAALHVVLDGVLRSGDRPQGGTRLPPPRSYYGEVPRDCRETLGFLHDCLEEAEANAIRVGRDGVEERKPGGGGGGEAGVAEAQGLPGGKGNCLGLAEEEGSSLVVSDSLPALSLNRKVLAKAYSRSLEYIANLRGSSLTFREWRYKHSR